jgi:glycosyltransferase involved in cell wall biosynthesis
MSQKSLHIVSHSFPTIEAPYDATFISDHASSLSDHFDVRVCIPTPRSFPFTYRFRKNHSPLILPDNVQGDRCLYLSLPKKRFPAFISRSLSKNIVKSLSGQPIDLIHVHFLYPTGMIISELKNEFNCPVVLTVHGVDFYHTYNKPGLKNILKSNLEQADAIVSVGPGLKQDIVNEYPGLNDKVHCIHNFVDTRIFKPVKKEILERLREELSIDPSSFQLLCVANFRHKKGIDTLIEALILMKKPDLPTLHLIGRVDEEPDFQARVRKKIETSGLKNVVIHGPKPREEIKKWMQAMDGFILPSRNEPFGIALIEAMACGLPVISTKSGGPEQILKENRGILIQPDKPKQLAKAIAQIQEIDSFDAEDQHAYIEENFGKNRYTKEYTSLYERLLSP